MAINNNLFLCTTFQVLNLIGAIGHGNRELIWIYEEKVIERVWEG